MGNYTLAQVEAYLDAIAAGEKEQRRFQLISLRAAKAKPDTFKRLLKEFD